MQAMNSHDSILLLSPRLAMDTIANPPFMQQSNIYCRTASPHSKRRRRTQKNVSFAEDALSYPTCLYAEEAASTWYSRQELEAFKTERRNLVVILKKNDFDLRRVGYHFCLRGLEPYFSLLANKSTKGARDAVMQTVFVEQERQRTSGLLDAEAMRTVVTEASRTAQQIAIKLGSSDAAEAMTIHGESLLEQLAIRAEKGLSSCIRRGVVKTPSLTQQEATSLTRALQQRQD